MDRSGFSKRIEKYSPAGTNHWAHVNNDSTFNWRSLVLPSGTDSSNTYGQSYHTIHQKFAPYGKDYPNAKLYNYYLSQPKCQENLSCVKYTQDRKDCELCVVYNGASPGCVKAICGLRFDV